MNRHLRLVVKQSEQDKSNIAVCMREAGSSDKLLAHIHLSDLSFLDDDAVTELTGSFAKQIAKKLQEHLVCGGGNPESEDWQESKAGMATNQLIRSLGMPVATSEGCRK